ncbi:hypothetical protein L6164_024139 [Bauhinia variegata]|uniref:Uncharacterized protein n=1 Tax=Bauhinia variegata TaxID=167791 RepID=A0ACB9LYX4_BAUVA|nr:hypothetical protein L6164_024139 [Bauhinia variegata]
MGSFIQIDSISIDLANNIDKKSAPDAGKCEHFSIRGYVSDIRKKDWKMCWPFPLKESYSESENPASLLPPLDMPKFKWRCCRNCQEEVSPESTEMDGQTAGSKSDRNCSNEAIPSNIQQDPMPDTVKRREIDLNNSIDDLSCGNCYEPFNDEKENKAEVAQSRLIDHEIGLDDNLNHQTASVPPKFYPGLRQEVSINESGFENKEVADLELSTSNLKACTVLSESTTVSEGGDTTDQTTGNPPLDSADCHHKVPETIESLVENDFQDHQLDKTTGLPRRRHRKVRLMTDLLRDNGEGKTEQMAIQGSPSNHSASLQTTSIPQVKVDVPGDLVSVGQSRKRKCLLDDQEPKLTEICSQKVENVVKNFEGDAETIDAFLDTGSKDVHADIDLQGGVKSYWGKPEIERSHTMGKKKGKRTQVIDNYLTSESHRKQQKESNKIIDGVNKLPVPKNRDSGSFTQKRTDNSPWQVPMTENEFDLLKGKGKMLLTGKDLGSLSSLKNGMLTGEKVMLNMPAAMPVHSAQCSLNEKRLEEGLHLSLNSYLAPQVYNKNMIHRIENQLPFSSPFQEGTSQVHQFLRNDRETNVVGELSIFSKQRTDAISGKGPCSEEIAVGRNTEKTAESLKQVGNMNYGDQTTDKTSEQGTLDDIPMEIVELMAKNQYERCLPDAENRNRLQEKSTVRRKMQMTVGNSLYGKGEFRSLQGGQMEKPQGRNGKNGMITTGENVRPSKRKSVHCVSLFDGNSLDMYGLCQPQSSFGIEVSKSQKKTSNGVHFSQMDSNLLVSAQNNKLNGNAAESGSSNSAVRSQGGCSLHKTILREDDEYSRIWASMNPNRAPPGYDIPRKVASQSTSNNNDVTSVRSGALLKHKFQRDIDLNYSNLDPTDLEKLNRNIGLGSFNRVHSEYPFPCKNNGIESHQNLKGSLDLYSNETIPAMHLLSLMDAGVQSSVPFKQGVSPQFLKRPYLDDCNTKLEIGTSKALGSGKRPPSAYCSKNYLSDKSHCCFLGAPTFGASTSSVQHNENFVRAAEFTGQISSKSAKKEKIKSSNSPVLNRHSKSPKSLHTRGELIKDCGAVPVYGAQKRFPSVSDGKQFSWPCLETETSTQGKLEVRGTCGTFLPMKKGCTLIKCSTNKNPADLPMPEAELYMIRGEDLKFEKASIPQMRPGLLTSHGRKQQRNLKRTKIKDHTKR